MFVNAMSVVSLPWPTLRPFDVSVGMQSYPNGGCWIVKVHKGVGVLGKLWQDMVWSAICSNYAFSRPALLARVVCMYVYLFICVCVYVCVCVCACARSASVPSASSLMT